MSYPREWLEACVGASIPDLIGDDCKLLFVGINPGLQTALTGIHFSHASNRFYAALQLAGMIDRVPNLSPPYPSVPLPRGEGRRDLSPALFAAGVIEGEVDRTSGFTDSDRRHLVERGIGITNLVNRATVRASELTRDELRAGAERLRRLVAEWAPAVVAVAGVTAYRSAFGAPKAAMGRQHADLAGAELWVVPNPSGLNAHETTASLAEWYLRVGEAAGIV